MTVTRTITPDNIAHAPTMSYANAHDSSKAQLTLTIMADAVRHEDGRDLGSNDVRKAPLCHQ